MGLVADTLESKFSAMSADEFVNWWESILADSPNCDGMSADDYLLKTVSRLMGCG